MLVKMDFAEPAEASVTREKGELKRPTPDLQNYSLWGVAQGSVPLKDFQVVLKSKRSVLT